MNLVLLKLSLTPSKIMQKLINVLAVSSAVVSLTVVGIGGYVYVRKDAIIESIKEKALGSLGGGALGGVTGGLSLPAPSNPVASPDATATPESPVPFGF